MYEDMYWIDAENGEIIASALDEKHESSVIYPEKMKKIIKGKINLMTMHTHPHSMPPSVADFNSAYLNGYGKCIVLCHDGKVFQYYSNEELSVKLYEMYIQDFIDEGCTEYEAQVKTLDKLKENYKIDFWEVT